MKVTRRTLLQTGAAAALAGAVPAGARELAHAGDPGNPGAFAPPATPQQPGIGLPQTGKLAPRASKAIAASPISIGFETLDRKSFDPERCYDLAGQLGVKWARVQTGWSRCETAPGVFDFSWLDDIVDRLRAQGIQPWFNLGYGNRLYIKEANSEFAVGWIPLYSEEAKTAWIRFVEKLADHFRTRVTHWELWNEPNIPNFWQPTKPNAEDYVRFVEMTAPLIRKRVPKSFLIGCGFSGTPFGFLETALQAGLAKHVDAVSFHPYRPTPEANYAGQVRALRGLLRRHKPSLALWQGENGAPSDPNSSGALSQFAWTEPAQAKWLTRRLVTDLAYGIDVTSYFLIVDLVNYVALKATGKTNFKGVLRGTDYTPKPSYAALQHVCRLFDAETKPADFVVDFADPRAVGLMSATFERKGRPLCVYWNPAALPEGAAPGEVDLQIWTGAAAAIERPVLVDLVSGAIYDAPAPKPGAMTAFAKMPLADAPIVLTDRSVIED
jgi:hypothetical protein